MKLPQHFFAYRRASRCVRLAFACLSFSCFALAALPAAAAEKPQVVVSLQSSPAAVFGGEDAAAVVQVGATRAVAGVLNFTQSVRGRTIARSSQAVRLSTGGNVVKLALKPLDVKPGVVFDSQLEVTFSGNVAAASKISDKQTVWAFPRDAFAGGRKTLSNMKLSVFDPAGDTVAVLKEAGVPFTRLPRAESLGGVRGLLLIGAGVAPAKFRGLTQSLTAAAEKGARVLWLEAAGGEFDFPLTPPGALPPTSVQLHRQRLITTLDKRLQTSGWKAGEPVASHTLQITTRRNRVVLENIEASDAPNGWMWFETRYPGGGALVVCNFNLISQWKDNPTPRYLLAAVLKYLNR